MAEPPHGALVHSRRSDNDRKLSRQVGSFPVRQCAAVAVQVDARTVVATNRGDRWFFVYGFKKNEKSDISDRELEAFQKFAADLLGRSAIELDKLVGLGELEEICDGHEA